MIIGYMEDGVAEVFRQRWSFAARPFAHRRQQELMTETNIDIARRLFEEGHQLQEEGQLEEATRLYQASINFHPTAEAHTYLAKVYSAQGHYDEAIAECRNAIEVDPSLGDPYNDIGAYLIDLRRWEEAVKWLRKALDAPRYEHRALPYMNLARIYAHRGQYLRMLRAYKYAWEADPSHLPALDAYQMLLCKLN
jgi:Tfp pilus assembly protein PilF